jgi:hypothetical protein
VCNGHLDAWWRRFAAMPEKDDWRLGKLPVRQLKGLSEKIDHRSPLGLTPCRHQSGESDRTGAISKCGDAMMRVML